MVGSKLDRIYQISNINICIYYDVSMTQAVADFKTRSELFIYSLIHTQTSTS